MRLMELILQWEDIHGMQVGFDFGSDGYRVTVEGYSADTGRY